MSRKSNRERDLSHIQKKAVAKAIAFRAGLVKASPKEYSNGFTGFKATPDNLMGNTHTTGFSLGQRRLKWQEPGKF